MKCPTCKEGVLRKANVRVERRGVFVGVFPTEACPHCGEQVFSESTAGKIEARLKKLGLWGMPVPSKIYRVGGNFVVSIKKRAAEILGIRGPREVVLIPEPKAKRLIVELG